MSGNTLKRAAVADAKHDFAGFEGFNTEGTSRSTPGYPEVLDGLPEVGSKPRFSELREDVLLKELNALFEGEGSASNNLKNHLLDSDYRKEIKIKGYNGEKDYRVSLLHSGSTMNVNTIIERKLLSIQDFKDFLEGDEINFLVDATFIGIMKFLASLRSPGKMEINLLVNRETINDPAGKLTEFEQGIPKSIKTDVLYDRGTETKTYKHHTKDDRSHDSMFFSKFDFSLSPLKIQQAGPQGVVKSANIEVNILKENKSFDRIVDPKTQNEINNCWDRIKHFFKKSNQKCVAGFQMKRSGDWFQALSCMEPRNYGSVKTGSVGPLKGSTILVTHDRLLLWFSLFMGIDVLYTNKDGTGDDFQKYMYYFKASFQPPDRVHSIKGHRIGALGIDFNVVWVGYEDGDDWWQDATTLIDLDVATEYAEKHNLKITKTSARSIFPLSNLIAKFIDSKECKKMLEYLHMYRKILEDMKQDLEKKVSDGLSDYKETMESLRHLSTLQAKFSEFKEFPREIEEFHKSGSLELAETIDSMKRCLEETMRCYPTEASIGEITRRVVNPIKPRKDLNLDEKAAIFEVVAEFRYETKEIFHFFSEYVKKLSEALGDDFAIRLYLDAIEMKGVEGLEEILEGEINEETLAVGLPLKSAANLLFFSRELRGGQRTKTKKRSRSRTRPPFEPSVSKFLLSMYFRELYYWISGIDFESDPDTEYYIEFISQARGYLSTCKTLEDWIYVVYTLLPTKSFLGRQIMLHSLGLDSISEGVQANYFLFPGKSYIVEARVNPIREKEELMKLPHITIDAVKGIDAVATPPRTPDRTTKRSKRINVF